jgi:hypothetical protein
MSALSVERRLRFAGGLVAAGLVVEIAVSSWVHPLAFVTFAVVACPLVGLGMVVFLWSLVESR